jgi:O-antigen/teichoic acid export membrane protein
MTLPGPEGAISAAASTVDPVSPRRPGRSASLSRRVLFTAMTNGGLAVLGLATGVLAARLLGPEGRGEFAAIQNWPMVLAALASLGLPDALVYFVARSQARAGRLVGSAVALALLSSIPFVVLGYLVLPGVLLAQTPATIEAARWCLVLIPLSAFGIGVQALRGLLDIVAWNLLRIVPGLAWLVMLVGAYTMGVSDSRTLTIFLIVASALTLVPILLVLRARISGPYTPDPGLWRPMVKFGLPSAVNTLPNLINLRLDQLLMAMFLPPEALGLYVVAVAWSMIPGLAVSALGTVLFPHLASVPPSVARDHMLAQILRFAVTGCVGVTAVSLLAAPLMVPALFGAGFRGAIPAALILVPAAGVLALNGVMADSLRGLGDNLTPLKSEIKGMVATIVLLAVLLPTLQIVGAAIASLIGYSVTFSVLLRRLRNKTGLRARDLLQPRRGDVQVMLAKLGLTSR